MAENATFLKVEGDIAHIKSQIRAAVASKDYVKVGQLQMSLTPLQLSMTPPPTPTPPTPRPPTQTPLRVQPPEPALGKVEGAIAKTESEIGLAVASKEYVKVGQLQMSLTSLLAGLPMQPAPAPAAGVLPLPAPQPTPQPPPATPEPTVSPTPSPMLVNQWGDANCDLYIAQNSARCQLGDDKMYAANCAKACFAAVNRTHPHHHSTTYVYPI